MDRSPPPFFNQGPSAHARLVFFSLVAIVLLVIDSRFALLSSLRLGVGTALYPVQRTLLIPRDAANLSGEYVTEITRLRKENTELRRIETANAKMLLQAEQLAAENARLRELLGARERTAVRSVIGEVLYDARDPFTRKVIIDKGLQHGVQPGQPVIDARGVVGQVTRAFQHSAEVTSLTDRNATLPVEAQRTGLRAVAFGVGAGELELRYLSSSAELKTGDLVVTSGLDGLYPPGLPVGKVVALERGDSSFSRVRLAPVAGADESKMLLVLLIDASTQEPPPPPEPAIDPRKRKKQEKE